MLVGKRTETPQKVVEHTEKAVKFLVWEGFWEFQCLCCWRSARRQIILAWSLQTCIMHNAPEKANAEKLNGLAWTAELDKKKENFSAQVVVEPKTVRNKEYTQKVKRSWNIKRFHLSKTERYVVEGQIESVEGRSWKRKKERHEVIYRYNTIENHWDEISNVRFEENKEFTKTPRNKVFWKPQKEEHIIENFKSIKNRCSEFPDGAWECWQS